MRRRRRSASRPNRRVPSSWRTRSPVEAGRAGRFGCVIGVDRGGQSPALREAGADVVVTSLAQVQVVEPPSAWSLVYDGFDPAREGMREALCPGNGYVATRQQSARADDRHYPGTYLPAATTGCAPLLPAGWSRTRIWSIFPTGSRSVSASPMRTGSILEQSPPVVPPGARSPARHAVPHHTLRGWPGAAHNAQGAPPGLDERHAPGRAGAGADRRELVRQRHGPYGDRRASSTGRSSIARSTTPPGRHGRGVARTACLCWCAPASRICMSRRRRARAFVNGQLREAHARSSTNRDTSDRIWYSTQQGETLVLEKLASCYTSRDQAISEPGLAARKAIMRVGPFEA